MKMNNEQQTLEWQSTITRQPRRINSDSRRRQEEDNDDDQPMMPVRSSAIVDDNVIPLTNLYPTISNLDRHGIAVGQPTVNPARTNEGSIYGDNYRYRYSPHHSETNEHCDQEDEHDIYHKLPTPPQRRSQVATIPPEARVDVPHVDNRHVPTTANRHSHPRPHTVTVPHRGVQRRLSGVTMSSDLFSFDGSEFEAIPAADDYMDDDQLQEYLDQLAKEEERKNKERESLKKEFFAMSVVNSRERESLRQLLQQLDGGGCEGNEDYEAYLDRLMEEQIQAEEQCKSKVARRVSEEMSC